MSNLRLIILLVGIALIVLIYLWEVIKQRREQRNEKFRQYIPDQEVPDINLSPLKDSDENYSDMLSALNQTLSESKEKIIEDSINHLDPSICDKESDDYKNTILRITLKNIIKELLAGKK